MFDIFEKPSFWVAFQPEEEAIDVIEFFDREDAEEFMESSPWTVAYHNVTGV